MKKFSELTNVQVCICTKIEDYSEDEYKPNSVNSMCVPFRLLCSYVQDVLLFKFTMPSCNYMVVTKTTNSNTCVCLLADMNQ